MIYNRELFFTEYRKYFGKLSQQQVNGLEFILSKFETSEKLTRQDAQAYTLATIQFETAHTFQPITEYGSQKYLKGKSYYPFIGRGYVQLTWKSNYKAFGDVLGIDLVSNPHLANEPETAWLILEEGMTDLSPQDPEFTKWSIEDFFNDEKQDFYNARKIINPKDYDSYKPIASNAERFYKVLKASLIEAHQAIAA